MKDQRQRKRCRLPGFDYRQAGLYFVTVVTLGRECLLGSIENNAMTLSTAGAIVQASWQEIPQHAPWVRPDTFIVMPNHVHGILEITATTADRPVVGARHASPASPASPVVRIGNNPQIGAPTGAAPPSRATHALPLPTHGWDGLGPSAPRATHASPLREVVRSLGVVIGGFKSASTRRVNESRGTPGLTLWQRGYFDHIVRHDDALECIRRYIETNPARWTEDHENPNARR